MRVLLLNDYGTPTGGAERICLGLRAQFQALGHDARLFASRARPGGAASLADEHCAGTTGRFRTLLQAANPSAYVALRRVLATFRPDVVHVSLFLTQLSPLILPLLRPYPTVHYAVWYRAICPRGTRLLPGGRECAASAGRACLSHGCLPPRDWPPLMAQMRYLRRHLDAFDRIVPISAAVRTRLEAAGLSVAPPILAGVPEVPPRPPLGGPPTIGFAGRLVPEKGVDLLLEAFARLRTRLPEARLVLCGEGPERSRLEVLATRRRLGAGVRFTGHLSAKELERELAQAWVQVVPSLWAEPLGLVAAEAAMRGTPVIATQGGGLAELVREGRTGLLVPPGDVGALAEALHYFAGHRGIAERVGHAARAEALAHFGERTAAEAFLALFSRLREEYAGRERAPGAPQQEKPHV